MATVSFDAWLPEVLPLVPECPDTIAINAIRNSCIDFCLQTNWWQGDYGTTAITTAILPYAFVLDTGVAMAQVMVATLSSNGRPLVITDIDTLDSRVINWRAETGEPRAIFQPTPGVVDFYPRPAGTDSYNIFMRIAYAPLRSATTVDDTVYEAWQEEIAAGALSRLMMIPNKVWTNADGATQYGNMFKAAKVQGAIETSKSYGRGSQQIQMRRI